MFTIIVIFLSLINNFCLSFSPQHVTLSAYLNEKALDSNLIDLITACSSACATISERLSTLPIQSCTEYVDIDRGINVQGEEQKAMDVISNNIFKNCVQEYAAALASEEEDDIIPGNGTKYEIAFDPLDGSSNVDVNAATGSIFGISPFISMDKSFTSSGRSLVAAGYSVYSSSTELVISLGPSGSLGACGFTLDIHSKEWILTREKLSCPLQGAYYSLNEGREPDWPDGLKKWVHDAKRGQTPSGTTYSSRYICSLCADVHRTIIKGGWAGNPRPHLRLLYEGAPLSHVVEACGGRGSDGTQDLLDIIPKSLHHRTSVFIGSKQDIDELESYGNIRQSAKSYKQ